MPGCRYRARLTVPSLPARRAGRNARTGFTTAKAERVPSPERQFGHRGLLPRHRPRRSRHGGSGSGALRIPAPAAPARPPHLLLQEREGRAGVDPQVLGGGLPVVSQVGGPVPHHEEVQELRGERRVRACGAALPREAGRSPSPSPANTPLHLPISFFNVSHLPQCAGRRLCRFGPRRGC